MDTPVEFLMVEDNAGDIHLAQEYFKDNKISNKLTILNDETILSAFLNHQGDYAEEKQPDVILLCLTKLLHIGSDVLAEIEQRQIPIVALTAFEGEEEGFAGNRPPANFYITKPLTLDTLRAIVLQIDHFGFALTRLKEIQACN